jgi:hypothetical protein
MNFDGKTRTVHYEYLHRGESIILKWILEKLVEIVWTRFIWLKIGTGGGLL